jgi:bifunctional non-homologous end joining protein LigD
MASLREYRLKRHFDRTPEPVGKMRRQESTRLFVVQKHRASQLHYDFRLEVDGVLKSWAVPKGPSTSPRVKRLAMAVEDHPLDYADFEGVIPEGYGAGTVMVWDRGTYSPETGGDASALLRKGELKFRLDAKKLKGLWMLVRIRERSWLLMKLHDRYASEEDITQTSPTSVLTRRTLAEIARDEGGDVAKAASGDPKILRKTVKRKRLDKSIP